MFTVFHILSTITVHWQSSSQGLGQAPGISSLHLMSKDFNRPHAPFHFESPSLAHHVWGLAKPVCVCKWREAKLATHPAGSGCRWAGAWTRNIMCASVSLGRRLFPGLSPPPELVWWPWVTHPCGLSLASLQPLASQHKTRDAEYLVISAMSWRHLPSSLVQ